MRVRRASTFVLSMLLLAACSLPTQASPPGPTQTSAASPVEVNGSISGRVWSDLCDPSAASPAPPGCVAVDSAGTLRANGILEGGEAGIPGVLVWMGAGACPTVGVASAATAPDGSYQFTGLGAGSYCVWVDPARGPDGRPLAPGIWSFPTISTPDGLASITTTLGPGEARGDVNFGWDYLGALAPTPAPSPTPPAGSTPTSAEDPRALLGEAAWHDPFDIEDNWPLYEDAHARFSVDGGRLTMRSLTAENWDGWMLTWPEIADFYVEGTFSPGSCSGLDRYGLMVRAGPTAQGYVGYLFAASCDGQYSLRAWDGAAFGELIGWEVGAGIPAGGEASVRLGVWAEGDRLRLYANGRRLAEATDATFSEGMFGVFIASVRSPGFEVNVDDVAYWSLP